MCVPVVGLPGVCAQTAGRLVALGGSGDDRVEASEACGVVKQILAVVPGNAMV